MSKQIAIKSPGPHGNQTKIWLDDADISAHCRGATIRLSIDEINSATLEVVCINAEEILAELEEVRIIHVCQSPQDHAAQIIPADWQYALSLALPDDFPDELLAKIYETVEPHIGRNTADVDTATGTADDSEYELNAALHKLGPDGTLLQATPIPEGIK